MVSFIVNGESINLTVAEDTPLLWVLRDHLKLTGTKFGCGKALCGACTVLINGRSTLSCVYPVSAVAGKKVTTIEGLKGSHPVQQAWIKHQVPQCGYCQPGQIMSAVSLLNENPMPTDQQIKDYMAGNICRCGTYPRILRAVKSASKQYYEVKSSQPTEQG